MTPTRYTRYSTVRSLKVMASFKEMLAAYLPGTCSEHITIPPEVAGKG
jgi:hypothetical protein